MPKVSQEKKEEIRIKYISGASPSALAREYKTSIHNIEGLIRRNKWKQQKTEIRAASNGKLKEEIIKKQVEQGFNSVKILEEGIEDLIKGAKKASVYTKEGAYSSANNLLKTRGVITGEYQEKNHVTVNIVSKAYKDALERIKQRKQELQQPDNPA